LAAELVEQAGTMAQVSRLPYFKEACSHLNQSLMELGALICTPRNPQCLICPLKKLCVAFKESRTEELPNLGKRETATARRFIAFVIEHGGKFLVRQRPAGVVNGHLWEFPNVEITGTKPNTADEFRKLFGMKPQVIQPLRTIKHSITRYRITLEAFSVSLAKRPVSEKGRWLTPEEFDSVAFSSAHKKLASAATQSILSGR
jgi:A/G-specific adenine glycosylase